VISAPRPPTVAEGVYLRLRHELVAGRLEPGRRLREQELAEALAVSRTPVREAVRRLAQEGLLELEANRGVRVPELRAYEAAATYEVRERLERMAARLAARHADDAGREALRARLTAMETLADDDPAAHVLADDAFHGAIARLSGNPVLAEMIERLADRVVRVKVLTRDLNVSDVARAQHRQIAEAILAGDEHRAELAMSRHVRGNLAIVMQRLTAVADAAAPEGANP
jgi:DNA-binding GntR family transcriptional regulator